MSENQTSNEDTKFSRLISIPFGYLKQLSPVVLLFVIGLFITVFSCIHYIATMLDWTYPGFSLDDSWIHLQFARTIYEGNPWEYSPGFPSTGSTSPLWSIILSSLFFFTQDHIALVWGTYIIAAIFYSLSTFLIGYIIHDYNDSLLYAVFGMVGFVLVPRTTWLMLSGMETPLFMFLLLLGVVLLDKKDIRYEPILGIVIGMAFLARPEGAILAIFVPVRFIMLGKSELQNRKRWLSLLLTILLATVVVMPWILHCLNTTGYPLPDTFYAKVHAPTAHEINVWRFWWNVWLMNYSFIIVGGVLGIALVVKKQPFTWFVAVGLVLLYRLNLPYASLINNARYLVPVFSFFFITAIAAFTKITPYIFKTEVKINRPDDRKILTLLIVAFVLIIPMTGEYLYQANFYGNAVKNINEQQVYIGYWLAENTPEDAVLAIHDAGALRFISNRSVIDLAGLVSPDIIHGNMSTLELFQYLRDNGCNYFVFFNELMIYYSALLRPGLTTLLTVHLDDNVISGRDTMSVYHVNWTRVPILNP